MKLWRPPAKTRARTTRRFRPCYGGQVGHSHQGRAFLFRPLVGHDEIRRHSVRDMLGRYFTGSRAELFMELLSDERITREELRQLENLVRSKRKE